MSMVNSTSASEIYKSYGTSQTNQDRKTDKVSDDTEKQSVTGKKVGDPKLTKGAAKYYEELKKKYAGMDFILVSKDMKEQAKAQAGKYANANKMVVLIDEEKIERMATDEKFRKQYEAIIAGASKKLSAIGSSAAKTGAKIKTYGMQVNDNGTASYFAVLEKSGNAQRQRIKEKAEQKKADKKKADKEAERQENEERLEESRGHGKEKDIRDGWDENTVTVTASSMEELIQKISDMQMAMLSDRVQTEEERQVGQRFDCSL